MKILRYPDSGHIHPYPTGEDLLDRSSPPFRAWIPEKSLLVLGYSQDPKIELNAAAVEATAIPVYQRKCGGGAVMLSPGVLCVGMRFRRRPGFGIPEYFSAANGFVREVLREELGLESECVGISDLAAGDRKILGSSLYLPRDCALYLASILVNAPIALWDRFLRMPSLSPDYRKDRSHAEFVRNLSEIPGLSFVTAPLLKEMLERKMGDGKLELDLT